jgi:FtsH-binding integral membrane protein
VKKGFSKMFLWLFIGLLITFGLGYVLSLYPVTMVKLLGGYKYLIICLIEVGVAIFFGARLQKMSKTTAIIRYVLYSMLTGLTFGAMFTVYKLSSILSVFLATSIFFLIFAIIGYVVKKDLSKLGMWLLMALIGTIVVSIINIFIGSSVVNTVISIIAILIFLGYVVYDMNTAERLMEEVGEDKGAIFGAFQLYLDFINIFTRLLELFGDLKDN